MSHNQLKVGSLYTANQVYPFVFIGVDKNYVLKGYKKFIFYSFYRNGFISFLDQQLHQVEEYK